MKEKDIYHWEGPNVGATNKSGFTGLPGGFRSNSGYYNVGSFGFWWSSTQFSANKAYDHYLYYASEGTFKFNDYKSNGYSVRCVKD